MIGIIPAAGYARRIAQISCSKEIYPITMDAYNSNRNKSRVISSCLLERLQAASIENIYMIIRDGKWDIPAYFSKQHDFKQNMAYLVTGATPGVPYTIDVAYPFVKNNMIAFGFPDIFFNPRNAFLKLIEKQKNTSADIILGLFEADDSRKVDMVEFDQKKKISGIHIKPEKTNLKFCWIIAVWAPAFTNFMHFYLSKKLESTTKEELYMGDMIQQALNSNLKLEYVKFKKGDYLDIGTPNDLKKVTEM